MSANIDIKKLEEKIDLQGSQIKSLNNTIGKLISVIEKQPKEIALTSLSRDIGIKRNTLYAHMLNNYEPGVDFDKVNKCIMIKSYVVPLIKDYYERKKK